MEKLDLFDPESPVPELNSAVWHAYLDLYDEHISCSQDLEIIATSSGAGFCTDALYVEGPATDRVFEWALLSPISCPRLPFTAARLKELGFEIAQTLSDGADGRFLIVTETFDFSPGPETDQSCYLWINSPRARLTTDLVTYQQSLAGKRRKQMRRLYRAYEDPAFCFELSSRLPDRKELDFIISCTRAQWKQGADYALTQSLWPIAAGRILPDSVRFMRVTYKSEMVFLNAYMVQDSVMISQSTCHDQEKFFDGLGTLIDFKTIELTNRQGGIEVLDPTCRSGLDDPESISTYKREIVNENAVKPILIMGDAKSIDSRSLKNYPHYEAESGWKYPDMPFVIGREA